MHNFITPDFGNSAFLFLISCVSRCCNIDFWRDSASVCRLLDIVLKDRLIELFAVLAKDFRL